jgi:hypothetical protein
MFPLDRSALFLSGLCAYALVAAGQYTLVTVFAHTAALVVAVATIYTAALKAWAALADLPIDDNKEEEHVPQFIEAKDVAVAADMINKAIAEVYKVCKARDVVFSIKVYMEIEKWFNIG